MVLTRWVSWLSCGSEPSDSPPSGRLPGLDCFRTVGARPGVANAMDHGDRREHSDNPEDWRHTIEQRPNDDQYQPLRPFHESHAAGSDQRLGPRPCVADHNGAHHHKPGQDDIEKSVATSIKDQQPEEL